MALKCAGEELFCHCYTCRASTSVPSPHSVRNIQVKLQVELLFTFLRGDEGREVTGQSTRDLVLVVTLTLIWNEVQSRKGSEPRGP